ncbi:unnamed protein product [Rotaria magnacalcarata]|uniref:Uncharacterized protein n=2 Tax=Rotaria magnacalcarata TaxID=392030 RepID=A0A8S2PGV6_9BILA|nr:unnamed protein product [Rotaria magnacalcarata]CAF4059677.1 unnamed protein product [Rotaria magnacalcarata]
MWYTVFGSDWTFQQDGARPHIHHLTQEWRRKHFPPFLDQYQWPPNSLDLNPPDYCIWTDLPKLSIIHNNDGITDVTMTT